MACLKCRPIGTTRSIHLPADLSAAIQMAKQALEQQIIVEVPERRSCGARPFDEISASGPWDDLVSYHFKCLSCAQVFVLKAETYRGSGGEWRRLRSSERA